jgi:hypothetical protein
VSIGLLLVAIATIILGATAPKPTGWVVVVLALIAILVHVFAGRIAISG